MGKHCSWSLVSIYGNTDDLAHEPGLEFRLIALAGSLLFALSLSYKSFTFLIACIIIFSITSLGHSVRVIGRHRKMFIAFLAVFLLSATLLVQHSHDDLISDTACVVCVYQGNLDTVINGTHTIPDIVVTRVYTNHFHSRALQFSLILAVARSPPIFLVG